MLKLLCFALVVQIAYVNASNEPANDTALAGSSSYTMVGLNAAPVDLSPQTVIAFAQTVTRKGASAYNISPVVYKQIQQDLAYLKTSVEVGNVDATADKPVVTRLFNNCLTAEHSDVNVLLGKIPGINALEKDALSAALTASAQALAQPQPKTLADCCSCLGKVGVSIALQLLNQQMK